MAERHHLDEPYILERVTLEHIQDLLRPLARTSLSPLPVRMRNACAQMLRQCGAMARELRHAPEAVRAEREREDADHQ